MTEKALAEREHLSVVTRGGGGGQGGGERRGIKKEMSIGR